MPGALTTYSAPLKELCTQEAGGSTRVVRPNSLTACAALYECYSLNCSGISICSTGAAVMVVTIAMMTIIAKTGGEMTCRSRPTLSTISSISPRVFMRVPMAAERRQERPVRRAVSDAPPNLPAAAATMIAPHRSH